MAVSSLPCPTLLRLLIRYDRRTGRLFWRERMEWMFSNGPRQRAVAKRFNSNWSGKEALSQIDQDGYLKGSLTAPNRPIRSVRAHRVAFAIQHGRWPDNQIDHINGDRTDNRPCNLRDVDCFGNAQNQKLPAHNTSGASGVSFDSKRRKWRARIIVAGRRIRLGDFDSFNGAANARRDAERQYCFGPNHGRG